MEVEARVSWRKAWLTPIGAMVVLLVLNLGVTTWLSLHAMEQRRITNQQVVEHRVATRQSHKQVAEFILCIAEHPPGDPARVACIDLVQASAASGGTAG